MKKTPRHKSKTVDEELVAKIEAFMASTGTTATKLGAEAIGDHRLLSDLRKGRELRRDTRSKLEAFLAAPLRSAAE